MTTDPTNVEYYENGKIKSETWLISGKFHNENGPSRIWYYENGQIEYKGWYINRELHNENGPACIYYYENGQIETQYWYINSKSHNENGPSDIYYNKNGKIKFQDWYINGEYLSEPEIIIQKELIEKRKIAINIICKNWLISKWNGYYREFLTQVLTVPKNHDSLVGKLFPNGGYDYKKFEESLLTF
jgi:hypothetical protein